MNELEFINNLNKENTDFPNERMARNLANSLESLSSDIFTEYIRFLFELIQNADDAKASKVAINIQDYYITIAHNGKEFDKKDVEAICSIGDGTKAADINKTGYKGIGFKSVFGKSKNVAIFSKGFHFSFTSKYEHPVYTESKMPWQIIPIWAEKEDYPLNFLESESFSTMNVVTVIELKETKILGSDLIELLNNGEFLLFLRNVIQITVNGNEQLDIVKSEIADKKYYKEICISKNGETISVWITNTFDKIPIEVKVRTELQNDDKTPVKLQNAEFAEISLAAKVENGKLKALCGNESLIYTFLPTKVNSFQFPFIINSSFLTNASREELHEDRLWNQWLMETTAKKIVDWLALLAKTKNYNFQILSLLPEATNIRGKLASKFYESFNAYAKQTAFIPNRKNQLIKCHETLIDRTGLSESDFISSDAVIEFINNSENKNLNNESFIHSKVESKRKLKILGAHFFDLENLDSFFTDDVFKKHHQPKQNFSLIKYFFDKASKDNTKEWNYKLKTSPFIYAKGNKLRSPDSVCFPSMDYETEFGDGLTLIHSEVFPKIEENPRIKEWLESIGVKDPSDTAYIENEIIGNIENCINEENYLKVTRFIFNLSKKGKLENHHRELQSLKLLTKNNEFVPAKDCYLSDIYRPSLKLESVYEQGRFVSENYIQSDDLIGEWNTFFHYYPKL